MTPISERQRERKAKKCETFIYIQKSGHFEKRKTICVTFYSQKTRHFKLRNFSWNVWNWHLYLYKKHETMRYVTFLYTKIQTLEKRKTICVRFFIYKKPDTLRYVIFHGIFEIDGGGGEGISINKNNALYVRFYMQKLIHFPLRFNIQKSRHFASHFYMQKNNALCVTFLYLKFIV